MIYGLLCAGDDELAPLAALSEIYEKKQKAMLTFYCGKLAGKDVVTLYSGAGKVNAALAAELLIESFGCGALINAGTAGGLFARPFDTVVCTECAFHDMDADILTDFHPWLPSVWMPSDKSLVAAAERVASRFASPVLFGRTVTGDKFIGEEEKQRLVKEFAPLCADMETAAAALVCRANGVPFLAVRTVTDLADGGGRESFEKNCKKASAAAAAFVKELLSEYEEG